MKQILNHHARRFDALYRLLTGVERPGTPRPLPPTDHLRRDIGLPETHAEMPAPRSHL